MLEEARIQLQQLKQKEAAIQDADKSFDEAIRKYKKDHESAQRKREEALEKDDFKAAKVHDAEVKQFASKIDEEEVAKASSIEKLQEDFETAKERWYRPFEMKKDLEKEAKRL